MKLTGRQTCEKHECNCETVYNMTASATYFSDVQNNVIVQTSSFTFMSGIVRREQQTCGDVCSLDEGRELRLRRK